MKYIEPQASLEVAYKSDVISENTGPSQFSKVGHPTHTLSWNGTKTEFVDEYILISKLVDELYDKNPSVFVIDWVGDVNWNTSP